MKIHSKACALKTRPGNLVTSDPNFDTPVPISISRNFSPFTIFQYISNNFNIFPVILKIAKALPWLYSATKQKLYGMVPQVIKKNNVAQVSGISNLKETKNCIVGWKVIAISMNRLIYLLVEMLCQISWRRSRRSPFFQVWFVCVYCILQSYNFICIYLHSCGILLNDLH